MSRHSAYPVIVDTGNPALTARTKPPGFLIIQLHLCVYLILVTGAVTQAQTKPDSVINTPEPQLLFIKNDFLLPIKNYKVDEGISLVEESPAFEPAPAINLNLPVFSRSHLFKKPIVAKDFNLDVSPDFKLKVKRYIAPGFISGETAGSGFFWRR